MDLLSIQKVTGANCVLTINPAVCLCDQMNFNITVYLTRRQIGTGDVIVYHYVTPRASDIEHVDAGITHLFTQLRKMSPPLHIRKGKSE